MDERVCRMCVSEIVDAALKCETCSSPDKFCVHEKYAALPMDLDHPLHPHHTLSLKCRTCSSPDKFWVHEKCAALPMDLDHPLHPHHTLSLLIQRYFSEILMCSLCREVIEEYRLACPICDFTICIRCAFVKELEEVRFDNRGYQYTLSNHLFHQHHELTLAAVKRRSFLPNHLYECRVCEESCVDSLAYFCSLYGCGAFFHTGCLQWPSVIEFHPLHPAHMLKLNGVRKNYEGLGHTRCLACGETIRSPGWYECEMYQSASDTDCVVAFHLQCGSSLGRLLRYNRVDHHLYHIHKSSQGRRLTYKHVDHPLYYFHKIPYSWYDDDKDCGVCGGETRRSFYKCRGCNLHFHLSCLRLPRAAIHKLHLHRLIFKESTDLGGYYCDVCEEPRGSHYPAYCCDDCDFVAHVECIVSEENASNVVLQEIEESESSSSK